MNGTHENLPGAARSVYCDLVAHAGLQAPPLSVAELRRQPGPLGAAKLPANFLKHADEQTVVGLSAIFHAIAAHGLQAVSFADWGVLAAPRFLARSMMITAIQRFLAEGAWGVSPHTIPHRSLHSLSGTVSHALKIHGPNFGVGGGHQGAVEVLLAAVALLERQRPPGVWVVWTAQEPEGEMDLAGNGDPNTVCRALAIALTLPRPEWRGPRLQLKVGAPGRAETPGKVDYFYLDTLLNQLGHIREHGHKVGRELDTGVRVDMEWAPGHRVNGTGGKQNGAAGPLKLALRDTHPLAAAEIE